MEEEIGWTSCADERRKMWRVAESKVIRRLTFNSRSCYSYTVFFAPCPLTPGASFHSNFGPGPSTNDLCGI